MYIVGGVELEITEVGEKYCRIRRLVTSRFFSSSDLPICRSVFKITAGRNESILVESRFVTLDLAKFQKNSLFTHLLLLELVLVVVTTKTNSNIKEAKVQEVHGSNPIEVVKPIVVIWVIPLRL